VSLGTLLGGVDSEATAVNGDGDVVVGDGSEPGYDWGIALRWSSATGMTNFGTPEGWLSRGRGVSLDGAVIVGFSQYYPYAGYPTSPHAFRWTSGTGMVDLGVFAGGNDQSHATAVSGDGLVVVGYANTANGDRAFTWTAAGGMVSIGVLPAGGDYSYAYGVNADGSVVVGQVNQLNGDVAFRWTWAGGMESLGILPGAESASAEGVSGDGSVIVGSTGPPFLQRAFLWTPSLGMVDLNTYLPSIGVDLSGWTLTDATGISQDGITIVGNGVHLDHTEAWAADLVTRPTCYANCDQSPCAPVLNANDFSCFLNKFAAGDSYANCDGSTTPPVLNANDFVCFLNKFAAGCS
jgi:probable HAF family extracellular repeat protein